MAALSAASAPTEVEVRAQFLIASLLTESIAAPLVPSSRVYLFGSALNGFAKWSSDIDLAIRLPSEARTTNNNHPLRYASRYDTGSHKWSSLKRNGTYS